MKFYSYEYVLGQISQQDWVMVILSALLILVTGFFAFKAYQDKRGSKFRELSIISILALVAVVLISISNLQSNQSTNNQFRNSLNFIEIVSKELGWYDIKGKDRKEVIREVKDVLRKNQPYEQNISVVDIYIVQ